MPAPGRFDQGLRGIAVIAGLAVGLLAVAMGAPSQSADACKDACLKAQLERVAAGDPAAIRDHGAAMQDYLKKTHGGKLPQTAPGQAAGQVGSNNSDLVRDIAAYLKAPPAKPA